MSAILGFFRIEGGVVVQDSDLSFGVRTARDEDNDGGGGWSEVSQDLELTEKGPYRQVSSHCFSLVVLSNLLVLFDRSFRADMGRTS